MNVFGRLVRAFSSRRSRHLVFLVHVWLCAPFLVLWLIDPEVRRVLGEHTVHALEPILVATVGYLAVRTGIAWRDSEKLAWEYIFPPIDVALITLILSVSHRGPMSNITLLYFLPMIAASGSLNVRWALLVGLMVVAGTALSVFPIVTNVPIPPTELSVDLLKEERLNIAFRLFFVMLLASLMAYQALIAAELRERLGVAADRNRIAMEMHDGVQGHLIAIASQLELIGRIAGRDGDRAAEIAREGREMTRQAADELRFLVQRLRAPALMEGFVPALRQYAHNLCERSGLRLVFQAEGTPAALDPEVENALFRIAQESLSNVVKHAGASEVSVTLAFGHSEVSMEIRDDGGGFGDLRTDGVGLENMRQRAQKAHGTFDVRSERAVGTRIRTTFQVRTE